MSTCSAETKPRASLSLSEVKRIPGSVRQSWIEPSFLAILMSVHKGASWAELRFPQLWLGGNNVCLLVHNRAFPTTLDAGRFQWERVWQRPVSNNLIHYFANVLFIHMHWLVRPQNFKGNKTPGPHFRPHLCLKVSWWGRWGGLNSSPAMQICQGRWQVQRWSVKGRWKEEVESPVWCLCAYCMHYHVIIMCLVIVLIQTFKNVYSFLNWPKILKNVYWDRQYDIAIKSTNPGAMMFLTKVYWHGDIRELY